MKAGMALPQDSYYESYPQLENGVGMMRLLITEFEEELIKSGELYLRSEAALHEKNFGFSVATGYAACEYLTKLLKTAAEKYDNIHGRVCAVRNDFFGEQITVSGLITGKDIIAQLRGRDLGGRLLIPRNMLRHGDDVFLDDVTVSELSEALGVPIRVVGQNGADLLRAFMGD